LESCFYKSKNLVILKKSQQLQKTISFIFYFYCFFISLIFCVNLFNVSLLFFFTPFIKFSIFLFLSLLSSLSASCFFFSLSLFFFFSLPLLFCFLKFLNFFSLLFKIYDIIWFYSKKKSILAYVSNKIHISMIQIISIFFWVEYTTKC